MQTDPVRLFIDAWRLMTGRLGTPRFEEADGLACCLCDAPNLFFNLWIQSRATETAEELSALLAAGQARADGHDPPVGGILCEDWLPSNWEAVVEESGIVPLLPMISMETDELLAPRRPPAELEIRRVEDDRGARDLAMLNAGAYEMPTESFECMSTMAFWPGGDHAFVGYDGGKPVSCAATLPVLGTVYVALVATSADARGKGYAETVMRHTVAAGQKAMGVQRTTLHASMMGHPLYEAMGYASATPLVLVGPPVDG